MKHAGFLVLKSPDIPSILVETAFISNPGEEARLLDSKHQQRLAEAIHAGVRTYFSENPPPGHAASRNSDSNRTAPPSSRAQLEQSGGCRRYRRNRFLRSGILRPAVSYACRTMPIKVLPEQLIHQIAAGEVIERPASVIKELVENSIDAGAKRIDIDIEDGGARLCRVRDDGSGIQSDELALALSRHATSKITTIDDLERVGTLGFVAKPCPSIASVSRMRLASRTSDQSLGFAISSDNGALSALEPTSHPVGTTVEVRDLFFNVPARRKFLRAERTETQHISRMIERLALASFDKAFSLSVGRKQVFDLPSTASQLDRERRVAQIVGEEFMANALYIEHEATGCKLTGWICQPTFGRAQPDLQYFYLNGRMLARSSRRRMPCAWAIAMCCFMVDTRHMCCSSSSTLRKST